MILEFSVTNWLYITLSVFIAILLYFWGIAPYRRSRIVAAVGDLPGPTPLPFVGHFFDLIKHRGRVHLQLDEYYKKYGRLFAFVLFGRPTIVINVPEILKDLLVKEFNSFHDRPVIFLLPKPFDSMMATATGETWHRIRTTLSPVFSAHRLKVMVPLLNSSCDKLSQKLCQAAKTGETIDIYNYHKALTMEALLAAFFGIESNAQTDPDDFAYKAAQESFKMGKLKRIFVSLLMLLPGASLVMKFFPSIFVGQFSRIVSLTEKIIEAKRNNPDQGTKDVLDLMLNCNQNPEVADNKRLSESELIAQCVMFLMAGYETTSSTLALTCHHLATSPDIQEKLQREIDEAWSDENHLPSYETVQSLPYLDMVISEVLRLYSPAFVITRECTQDYIIKGHLRIKKGTSILVLPYSMQHDPDFFPDPERFDPERFSGEAKQARDPYTFFLFGHGPRNCIGKRFALMEIKLALVRVLKGFSFVVAPETKIPPELEFKSSLEPINGVKLRIKCRD